MRLCTVLAMAFLCGAPTSVAAQSDLQAIGTICSAAFDHGISESYELLTEQTQYELMKTRLCHHKFSSYDELSRVSGTLGITIPIADSLLNLQGTLDAKRASFSQNYESFCNATYAESYYRLFTQERKTQVSRVLAAVWQECIKTASATYLDQKGILISITPFDAMRQFTVDIQVKVPSGQKPKIIQIAPAGAVHCESNTGMEIAPGFEMPLPEYKLTCKKDPTQSVPFSVTVDPGGLTKTVSVPSQVDRIAELLAAVSALQSENASLHSVADSLAGRLAAAEGKIPMSIELFDCKWVEPWRKKDDPAVCPDGQVMTAIIEGSKNNDQRIHCCKARPK